MIRLPNPLPIIAPLGQVIQDRKSIREYAKKEISVNLLSQLLQAANGLTHFEKGYKLRSAPSGGALYPVDTYIYAADVESLEHGLYRYDVESHSLVMSKSGKFAQRLYKASYDQGCVGTSPLIIIFVACFERITKKYGERGYMYTHQETGSISQNVYLAATALGLGTVAVGAFKDDEVGSIMGLDSAKETAVMLMPVGYPTNK
jgi:SagB-type dehydrogenase family enzyme